VEDRSRSLYVASFGATGINPSTYGAVVPVNINTGQVGTSIKVSAYPEGMVADSSGSTVYAMDAFQSTITPIQAATGAPESPIHVPGANGIVLLPTGLSETRRG